MEAFQSGFVLTLLQDLLERFKALVIDEVGQAVQFDVEEDLRKLERQLLKAQALLDSFQLTTHRDWQQWVGDVTRVCYDAEDLVDDIMLGASKNSVLEKILSFFTRRSTARKIQELQDRLEGIVSGLETVVKTKQQAPQCSLGCLKECVYGLPEKLFGRDEDKESIITMLLEEEISCVSIVGMDGLGKTTLAQVVHRDSRIRAIFHRIVWVPVSAEFDLIKVAEPILHKRLESENVFLPERIQCLFQDLYQGKSILIVLDDLWDVKQNDWDFFSDIFISSSSSKVLLTTRNPNIALGTNATKYYLQRMSNEDCQALIMDRALSVNNLSERQRADLVDIAGAMAQKCKGLPVAANVLGLLLSSKPCEDDWMTLSERDICEVRAFKEKIFPALRLNHPDLASHLKKCLAYCSLFPYNYDFKKDHLVQLWIAEGFVLPEGTTSLEEIGSDYFDDLLWRSIFQTIRVGDHDHEFSTYKMHEFIHKFAQFLASDTCFRLEERKWPCSGPWYKKARHLSVLCHSMEMLFLEDIEKCDGLRTFLVLSEHGTQIGQLPYSIFLKLLRLRVLDLSHTDVDELPKSIGRLKHLRYLDLSRTNIVRLPESASDLLGLQVLKLRDCFELLELPKNTNKLTNLVHLDVDIKGLRCMPPSIGSLSCLRTLPAFIVGKRGGKRITELKNLKFLRGTICLSDLENVKDGAEANEAMLCDKRFKRLELVWSRYIRDGSIARDVLAGLRPHKNLRELQVINYAGTRFPDWLTSSSCMLVSIHLQNCRQYDVLPSLGQLRFLKTLHIEGMHGVTAVDRHFYGEGTSGGFPSLESLKIQDMMCLTKWLGFQENSLQRLRDLTIEDCPNLCSMESLNGMNSLLTLEINGCPRIVNLPELPTSLQSLIIIESDGLKQQYHAMGGLEWSIVKAVPHVEIDFIQIRVP